MKAISNANIQDAQSNGSDPRDLGLETSEVLVLLNNTSLAERALSKQVGKKVQYVIIQDIIGTSNIAERLFSVAGNICTPSRSSMCPTTFEETLF